MDLPLMAFYVYTQWESAWIFIALLAVITAVIINTIFLMVGRAFSIRELENFAKSEILQSAATALMAIFLVVMVNSALEVTRDYIAGDLVCGGEPVHISSETDAVMDDAFAAIRCRLQERASEIAAVQDEINTSAGTYFKFLGLNSIVTFFGIQAFKGDWVTSLYQSVEQDRITNNLATVLLIGLNGQSALLEYLRLNMLNVFIPFGILLRGFYFTRSVGAFFISLGVGMYFLFPIFFVLLDPGFVAAPPPPSLGVPIPQQYCYATMTNTISVMTTLEEAGVGTSSGLTTAGVQEALSKSYISLMLHPLIAFFMTMIFVRYMMSILGGDTYALTRMVSKVI